MTLEAVKDRLHCGVFIESIVKSGIKCLESQTQHSLGQRQVISYVLAVTMLFSADNKKVTLKARGKAITTVINVEEMTRPRFTENFNASKISFGTEQLPMQEEGTRAVSTIEITLATEAKPKEDAETIEATKN